MVVGRMGVDRTLLVVDIGVVHRLVGRRQRQAS